MVRLCTACTGRHMHNGMFVTVAGVSYTSQCAGHTNDTHEQHYITQDRGAVSPLQCRVCRDCFICSEGERVAMKCILHKTRTIPWGAYQARVL